MPRSVFVPYFRYLLAPALEALESAGAATEPRKKRKKKDAVVTDADALAPDAHDQWRLRVQVRTQTLSATDLVRVRCRLPLSPCR